MIFEPTTHQQESAKRTKDDFFKAVKILGIRTKPGDLTQKDMLSHFHVKVHEKKYTKTQLEKFVDSKNILNRIFISKEISIKGNFSCQIPFEKPCEVCKGLGEQLHIYKKMIYLDCKVCNKTGKVQVKCRDCKGTGKYGNVDCRKCAGSENHTITVKCFICLGKGSQGKQVLEAGIKGSTICANCIGFGFHFPLPEGVTFNTPFSNLPTIIKAAAPPIEDPIIPTDFEGEAAIQPTA